MLSADEFSALLLSLKVGFWAVLFALPLALGVAWLLARRRFAGRMLLDGIVHLPLVLPPVVIGYGLLVLFGRQGPLGALLDGLFGMRIAFAWEGAAVAAAVMAFPLMVRAIRLSLEGVDRGLEDAARTLGAPRVWVFLTVTLPLVAPGLLAAVLLGFARALGEFGATITFVSNIPGETRTLPLALYTATQTPAGDIVALRLALLSVALAFAALVGSELLARRLTARGRYGAGPGKGRDDA